MAETRLTTAGNLKVGSYVIFQNQACVVKSIQTSKTGKSSTAAKWTLRCRKNGSIRIVFNPNSPVKETSHNFWEPLFPRCCGFCLFEDKQICQAWHILLHSGLCTGLSYLSFLQLLVLYNRTTASATLARNGRQCRCRQDHKMFVRAILDSFHHGLYRFYQQSILRQI